MKTRIVAAVAFGLALALSAVAQDSTTAPPAGAGQGPRGGRGGFGGGMMGAGGRGTTGTVTEVAADHYTIKTETGETYTVHFSANTRMMKQAAQGRGQRGQGGDAAQPVSLKPTDIKVGDAIAAMGEVDAAAKSIGAVMVIQIDPERARQMREMQANYGKTWLMGKVTAINEVKVTLMGSVDNTAHSFVADENTTFRKRRDPVTLADVQVGDVVRVDGAVKDGQFVATAVNVMPAGGMARVPRGSQQGGAPPDGPQ